MSISLDAARGQFKEIFGGEGEILTRAPGRVNIIGEHTDYNHGFVLPMALENETVIVARKRQDMILNGYAANMDRRGQSNLELCQRHEEESWMDYLVGVASELKKLDKPLTGADLLILGDVPLGCGLSSSAALEMAALCMFESLGGFRLDGPEGARLGQRVENDFLGLSTGIMDQFISRCGKAGHGLFLDCRSYTYELIPIAFDKATFIIANTCCSRGLTASKYNERVSECQSAVRTMQETLGHAGTHLRDFSCEDLEEARDSMDAVAYRRARHVISEDVRTQAACKAMKAGQVAELGQLMSASDASLREDYEVTSPELDAMTAIARSLDGCYGARMTGAGFGGCTINLVALDAADAFCDQLMAGYQERMGIAGEIIRSAPAEGASIIQ